MLVSRPRSLFPRRIAVGLAFASMSTAATASAAVFEDATRSFKLDLAIPGATVCVAKPAAMRIAADCEGLTPVAGRAIEASRADLVVAVKDDPAAGGLGWLITGARKTNADGRAMSKQEAAALLVDHEKGSEPNAAGGDLRGLHPGETHTLLIERGHQVVRTSWAVPAKVGEGAEKQRASSAFFVTRDATWELAVTRLGPEASPVDTEAALTRLSARVDVVPPAGPVVWADRAPEVGQWTLAAGMVFLALIMAGLTKLAARF